MDASYNSWRLGIVSFTGMVPAAFVCLTITGILGLIFDSWIIWPCWERTEAGESFAGLCVCVCVCNFFFILRFCFSALGPLFCIKSWNSTNLMSACHLGLWETVPTGVWQAAYRARDGRRNLLLPLCFLFPGGSLELCPRDGSKAFL